MARLARVLSVDTPYHITQRGNARQLVFESDADRLVYLGLLADQCQTQRLSLVGYCLMSNHVHLVAIPRRSDSLPLALKYAHGRYATYLNARHASSGHVWQGRYYSCALDSHHFWAALRYVELNPVRAGMVAEAIEYPWSSATAHCDGLPDLLLETRPFTDAWDCADWREYLDTAGGLEEAERIRKATHTGRPLGNAEFVSELERELGRRLAPQRGGRPRREQPQDGQLVMVAG